MARTPSKPAAKQPANEPKAKLAKISEITSRGTSYKQVWMPRHVGDELVKGATYDVQVKDDGSIVLKPVEAAAQ